MTFDADVTDTGQALLHTLTGQPSPRLPALDRMLGERSVAARDAGRAALRGVFIQPLAS
jgi:hypothetical protein